jgi:DNA primase
LVREPLTAPEGATRSEWVKASVTVLEFVSQYVGLKPTASGAIGLCPFHDDHHLSFGINVEGSYWHCFAGCGGGSVIGFWMRWRKCDFTTAVRELAEMVLWTTAHTRKSHVKGKLSRVGREWRRGGRLPRRP